MAFYFHRVVTSCSIVYFCLSLPLLQREKNNCKSLISYISIHDSIPMKDGRIATKKLDRVHLSGVETEKDIW